MKVKQLVWVASPRHDGIQKAYTPFGVYTVFKDGEVWSPGMGQVEDGTRPGLVTISDETQANGKSWAQADFERRVAECVEADPS